MVKPAMHAQLVWDRGTAGTAQAVSGCSITVGPNGEWTPEQLLVAAIEASLMHAFLRLADEAGLVVLGYVSAAEAELGPDPASPTRIVVRPCIVVAHERDREPALAFVQRAMTESPIARALGACVRTTGEVIVMSSAEGQ